MSLTDEHLVVLRDGIEASTAVSMGERGEGGHARERGRERKANYKSYECVRGGGMSE